MDISGEEIVVSSNKVHDLWLWVSCLMVSCLPEDLSDALDKVLRASSTAIPSMPELLAVWSIVFHKMCLFFMPSGRKLDLPSECIENLLRDWKWA